MERKVEMDFLRLSDPTDGDHSGLMDNNDLTESLLSPEPDITDDGRHGNNANNNNNPRDPPPSHPISMASHWIRRAGHFVGYITLLTMLVVVPYTLYEALRNNRADLAAFHSAEVMVVGTIIMSIRLVYLHLTHWHMPDVQKYVVRILWMVPLYSFQSWLSLRFHGARVYTDAIRDLYEAFVISSFVYYLIELLGGEDSLVRILQNKQDPSLGVHSFPFSFVLKPWEMGKDFMLQCKHGVLQYVVVKTGMTVLTALFEGMDIYGEGQFSPFVAYPYMAFSLNISVMYALYCLVKFFYAVNDELCHPINWRPLGKFLCIKGVVFFTWWQGVLIFYLRAHGIIEDVGTWKAHDVANGLIDYCVCFEMVLFAIAHSYTFSYKEYLPDRFATISADHAVVVPRIILERPLRPRDALWSSTVPNETLSDIQKMRRTGVGGGASDDDYDDDALASPRGAISLQEVMGSYETASQVEDLVV